jgi:hypothetical protein
VLLTCVATWLVVAAGDALSSQVGVQQGLVDTQSSSGAQTIGSTESFTSPDGTRTDISTSHRRDANGSVHETQTITTRDASGNTYSETHTWDYDARTGRSSESHTSQGAPPPEGEDAPPIDSGGVEAEGHANDAAVTSRYGEGGVADHFGDGHADYTNLKDGTRTMDRPSEDYAIKGDAVPARTIPLVCAVMTTGFDYYDSMPALPPKGAMPDVSGMSLADAARALTTALPKVLQMMPSVDAFMQMMAVAPGTMTRASRMELRKVPSRTPVRISGYRIDQYKVIGNGRVRADIWVARDIDLVKVLSGGAAPREAAAKQMLVPQWAQGNTEQEALFRHLVVRFKERGRATDFQLKRIAARPDYVYRDPELPAGRRIETYKIEDLQKQAEETQRLL